MNLLLQTSRTRIAAAAETDTRLWREKYDQVNLRCAQLTKVNEVLLQHIQNTNAFCIAMKQQAQEIERLRDQATQQNRLVQDLYQQLDVAYGNVVPPPNRAGTAVR